MYYAIVVDEGNRDKCKEILDVPGPIPQRCIEEQTWCVWDPNGTYRGLLPHVVFFDRFTVVETREDHRVVERI